MNSLLKLALVGLAGITLSGCLYKPSSLDVAKAEFVCKEHGGLYGLSMYKVGPSESGISCNDGKHFYIGRKDWRAINDPFIAERLQDK